MKLIAHGNYPELSNINTSPIEIFGDNLESEILIFADNTIAHGNDPELTNINTSPIEISIFSALSRMYNNLFEIGHFPDVFKLAHITAIWKQKGLKSSKLFYGPISLLPTLSKIYESVMHNRLLSHCTENNIISERQAACLA